MYVGYKRSVLLTEVSAAVAVTLCQGPSTWINNVFIFLLISNLKTPHTEQLCWPTIPSKCFCKTWEVFILNYHLFLFTAVLRADTVLAEPHSCLYFSWFAKVSKPMFTAQMTEHFVAYCYVHQIQTIFLPTTFLNKAFQWMFCTVSCSELIFFPPRWDKSEENLRLQHASLPLQQRSGDSSNSTLIPTDLKWDIEV